MTRWQRFCKKFRRDERGQAMTEFALVLPILLLILMGIVEFGRIFHAYIVINEAARDAVRYVSVAASESEVRDVILQDSQSLDETRVAFTISPGETYRRSGQPVTVQVTYPVQLITPVLNFVLPNPVNVTATMTMRKE